MPLARSFTLKDEALGIFNFEVLKKRPVAAVGSHDKRRFEVVMRDFCFRTYKILKKPVPLKTFSFHEVERIEKQDEMEVKVHFLPSLRQRPYQLLFENGRDRDLFFTLLSEGKKAEGTALGGSSSALEPERGSMERASPRRGKVRVRAVTWNMGNSEPPRDLSSLLRPFSSDDIEPDIIAVGTQECIWRGDSKGYDDQKAKADLQKRWEEAAGDGYRTLCSLKHWDRTLTILVRKSNWCRIADVEYGQENTGIAHIIGNKGAVLAKLNFYDTTICFVNSHLAAQKSDEANPGARNANVAEVVQNVKMGSKHIDVLNQFHYLFWMGDLNYRVDLPQDQCIQMIERGDLSEVLSYDQLHSEMKAGRVFRGFKEAEIEFAPTYRKEKGSPAYSREKNRTPSWCDRVVWKTLPGLSVTPLMYTSAAEIMTSDHIPVMFEAEVEVIRLTGDVTSAREKKVRTVLPQSAESEEGGEGEGGEEEGPPSLFDLVFTQIRLEDIPPMDANGYADPYVKVLVPHFQEKMTTPVQKRTLIPCWQDMDVMPIRSLPITPDEMDFVTVVFRAMDWDSASADDLIGCASISLGVFKDHLNEECKFEAELTKGGQYRGRICGAAIVRSTIL
mmetsp:Transcript_48677/g.126326  ORF Transcript_48677/g.126326 Transcript_48677/m.126326 type:complete len:616 (-) Transcript_48677:315-2162(-)